MESRSRQRLSFKSAVRWRQRWSRKRHLDDTSVALSKQLDSTSCCLRCLLAVSRHATAANGTSVPSKQTFDPPLVRNSVLTDRKLVRASTVLCRRYTNVLHVKIRKFTIGKVGRYVDRFIHGALKENVRTQRCRGNEGCSTLTDPPLRNVCP